MDAEHGWAVLDLTSLSGSMSGTHTLSRRNRPGSVGRRRPWRGCVVSATRDAVGVLVK